MGNRSERLPATVGIAAGLLLLLSTEASAIQVIPAEPTDADSVKIVVGGWFSDSCWEIFDYHCEHDPATLLAVKVYTVDNYAPGRVCLPIILDYQFTCNFGILPAGEYTAGFVEYHASVRTPEPTVELMPFTVRQSTPTVPITWARIRALYR